MRRASRPCREALLRAFDGVAESGEPRWWSLEAAPGWGKTRLVQEFYAQWGVQRGQQELREVLHCRRAVRWRMSCRLSWSGWLGAAGLPIVIAVEDVHAADLSVDDRLALAI